MQVKHVVKYWQSYKNYAAKRINDSDVFVDDAEKKKIFMETASRHKLKYPRTHLIILKTFTACPFSMGESSRLYFFNASIAVRFN